MTTKAKPTLGQQIDELSRRADAVCKALDRPYVWPIVAGRKAPQGTCSLCQTKDKRHPDGMACDYSCVGV